MELTNEKMIETLILYFADSGNAGRKTDDY